jgi:ribose transport system substrate-binding protein
LTTPDTPAPAQGRRRFCLGLTGALLGLAAPPALRAEGRRFTVAFANLTEEAGVTLEGTGFTGRDVRESFVLAARRLPIDLVLYDNHDGARAVASAEDAIARRIDLYVQYQRDPALNAAVADRLRAARIPVLAINHPVPGAPLYTVDNEAAGTIAGEALGHFAARAWRGEPLVAVLVGPLTAPRIGARADGVRQGLKRSSPATRISELDTQGNLARVGPLLGKFLAAQPAAKTLIAAMDDATALAAKSASEAAGRLADVAIVSHGADRSVHGGMNDRKEIDPNNRGSVVIGSVAFYLDRYGDDVLPLALRRLRGETLPALTRTHHRLITAANVFVEYPPTDMN